MAPLTDDIRAALDVVAPKTAQGPATEGAYVPECESWVKGFCTLTGTPCQAWAPLQSGCHLKPMGPLPSCSTCIHLGEGATGWLVPCRPHFEGRCDLSLKAWEAARMVCRTCRYHHDGLPVLTEPPAKREWKARMWCIFKGSDQNRTEGLVDPEHSCEYWKYSHIHGGGRE